MHDLIVVLAVLAVALSLAGFGLYVARSWAAYRRAQYLSTDREPVVWIQITGDATKLEDAFARAITDTSRIRKPADR